MITLMFLILYFQTKNYAQQHVENNMSQYFQNRMMWNAGFTGIDGEKVYLLQNKGWMGFIGAPVINYMSGELTFGTNSAIGLQIMTDRTGLIQRNSEMLSYSYRIKLSKERQIRIGVSLSLVGERLNAKDIDEGSALDPLITNNVDQSSKTDANLGFVYINKKLTLGLSFCRLSENISNNSIGNANLTMAKFGGSYEVGISRDGKMKLTPIWMFRMYRNTNSIADIGTQFAYDKFFNTMIVYQTTGNIRTGVGVDIKKVATANFFYNTNIRLANAASQQYEIGIGFKITEKKREK